MVWWLGGSWPDLIVGVAVDGSTAWGGVGLFRDAHDEHQKALYDAPNK